MRAPRVPNGGADPQGPGQELSSNLGRRQLSEEEQEAARTEYRLE